MIPVGAQVDRVAREGEALALAAAAGDLDSPVPGCPGWDVEQLLRHVGDVHRWAATVVRERVQERLRLDSAPGPGDVLVDWYRSGLHQLVDTLRTCSERESFWSWGPAPNALAFWARRQANETAVHRCDAQAARGHTEALPALEACDGIDEWLGLLPRRGCRATAGRGRVLRMSVTDSDGAWAVVLDEEVALDTQNRPADCTVRGGASEMYLWSMNRRGADGLEVTGDSSLLEVWSQNVRF